MSVCLGCGLAEHPDGAAFCSACGTRLPPRACGACGADVVPGGRFCASCGEPLADLGLGFASERQPATSTLVSARRLTSVLFGDLVGFTNLSESRDPEAVRELLSEYFEECQAVIGRYGGEVEKFIGDAVMAVWGVPVTIEDDAERAVRAGLELVARVAALGDRQGVPELALRVGIVTGEVAVTVGARQQGMVAGDAVNTAARVQAAATPGQVWVDETTRLLTASTISYVDVGSHSMKGKAEPVPLWAVRAVVDVVGGGARADGLEGPLVGRDRELRLVKEVFHGVEESGRPALMIVDGDPGVGKSRLGWEFEKYTDGLHSAVRWHSGRCIAYGEGVAYFALAEAIRGRLSAAVPETAADGAGYDPADVSIAELLARGLEAYVPVQDRDWIGPRVGALLGLETAGSFAREDLFSAWTAFFRAICLASEGDPEPVVLVVDDAHHADDGLLAYLEHLLMVADFPVFVLLLARPQLLDSSPTLASTRRVTVVHLEPLDGASVGQLLDGLVAGLPDRVRTDLVVRAEGVPLFAVETIRALIDRDLVVPRGGQYVLADPERLDVQALTAPATLQALIAARLDTLPAATRGVVDRASVLGLGFSRHDLADLCPDSPDLDDILSALVRQQVLRLETDRLSAERGQFRFVQSGVRQVAYGMLSRRDRKATHLAVCRSLEARDGATGELASVIAQHYLDAIEAVPEADDVAELAAAACHHLVHAADRASGLGSPAEAAAHLARALERCHPDERLRLEARLADQLRQAGRYDEAIEHAIHARDGLDSSGDLLGGAMATATLAQALLWGRGEAATVETMARERLRSTPADPSDPESLRVRLELVTSWGGALLRMGSDLRECAEEHVRLAEQTHDLRAIADSWLLYAVYWHGHGVNTLADLLMERAAEIGRETRDPRLLTVILVNSCAFAIPRDLSRACSLAREAMEAAARLGDQSWVPFCRVNALAAHLLNGDWRTHDLLAAEEITDPLALPWKVLTCAVVSGARGEPMPAVADQLPAAPELMEDLAYRSVRSAALAVEAMAAGDPAAGALGVDAVEIDFGINRMADDFTLLWVLATDIAWRSGDEAALRRLLEIVDGVTEPAPLGVRCQRARIRALQNARADDPSEVEQHFADAIGAARLWGSAVWEALICADLAAWLAAQGREEDSREPAARAREIYGDLGAVAWMRRLDDQLTRAAI